MNFFKNKIKRDKKSQIPPMPNFGEIVEMMYNKNLSFSETVVRVLYSEDKSKRFVLLKSDKGFYKYTYEEIRVCDEDEWNFICNTENPCPAWWEPMDRSFAYSFFGTEEEAMTALMNESEYKTYFVEK